MKTYIALLKGINVGGHKKVPMAELRELLTNAGFQKCTDLYSKWKCNFSIFRKSHQILETKIQSVISSTIWV